MKNLVARPEEAASAPARKTLRSRYEATRAHTEALAAALSPEDQCVQSMPDASPVKWHRAHTTWFFETFVATPFIQGYRPFDRRFQVLFNSYYVSVGDRHPRPARGLLTRPTADEVTAYRRAVDASLLAALPTLPQEAADLTGLGIQHEQQHQELLVTDILHAFAQNPLSPACLPDWQEPQGAPGPTRFIDMPGGIARLGARPQDGFSFDNEQPAHRVLLSPHRLANRLVRNADFADFIADGGYRTANLWMSDGFDRLQNEGFAAPLYWRRETPDAPWQQMTPAGLVPLDPENPVRHISWYEADAYARWAGARLPTEPELEAAATAPTEDFHEFTGHVWQWTGSAYLPYPGFTTAPGAVGEYNGKFMINQMVLRGGSAATPPGHARPTYRNFFPPEKRWQFTGLRLAKD
jgi:ergothioneine biosynthesis protein EgtB